MTAPTEAAIVALLCERIAPEFEPDEIDVNADLREQLDIDSMDIHQLAVEIYDAYGIDVPEADRAELTTVRRCVAYLTTHGSRP